MILVTGADGIVGRPLCEAMQSHAMEFLPVTHRRKPHTPANAVQVDLAKGFEPLGAHVGRLTCIVHLAAAVPHSSDYPDDIRSSTMTQSIDRNIHELQRITGAPLVYMSTCGLYDREAASEKLETTPIKVTSPYFEAKAKGEALLGSSGNCTILRLAAPIGRGLKPNLVLSRFIAAARANRAIEVWGSGHREQNYVDCRDIANLVLGVIRQPVATTLNVAASAPVTMSELAATVVAVVGGGTVRIGDRPDPRDGETARYSNEKASRLYQWFPEISLRDAIRNVADEDFEHN